MKKLLFIASCVLASTAQAQVGIGTTTPSSNAVLDVSSVNKGLMLPRVSDTLSVRNPSAGLMIFNRKTQSPAVHNGIRWNSLATAAAGAPVGRDSVTYTVSGGPFTAGTFGAASIDILIRNNIVVGGGGSGQGQGKPTFDNVRLYKPIDASSVAFFRAIASGTAATVIELKLYKTGAATPFYSIKLTNPRVIDYGFVYNSNPFIEQISLVATVYGCKDWITGASFAWDTTRNASAPY